MKSTMTRRMLWALSLASCMGLSCLAGPPVADIRPDITAAEALAHMRAAFGWQAFALNSQGWMIRGDCHEQGLDGSFVEMTAPDGRFLSETRTDLPSVMGHDGRTVWAVDHTGMPRTLALSSRDVTLGVSWVTAGVWLNPAKDSVHVAVDASQSNAEALAFDVTMADTFFRCTVAVDRTTWLPRSITVHLPMGTRHLEFSDYKAPEGFQVAHSIRIRGVSGEVSIYKVESVAPMPTFVRDPFEPRLERPDDTVFLPDVPAELKRVKLTATGHVLVRPRVENRDAGWFLLDTGAGMNCIDPDLADELGLEAFGEVSVVGVGGTERGGFRRGKHLTLGAMVMQGLPWLELDLSALEPIFGVEVNGVVGHDAFARSVVELDRDAGRVWVHDPDAWVRPENAAPLVVDLGAPCVECSFGEGRRGWFRFDTGSDDTVTFHGPAVERFNLIGDRKDLTPVKMAGVGGIQRGVRGPIEVFELCGTRFENLDVTFLRSSPGALNDPTTLGNIGGGLVRGFRVSIDLPHGELFLNRIE